ncbi:MAG: hydroxylamine oxidoreductase, partial [Planctomycetota bacterium]|nr:hydroxylamine oxidoreductase [Planctomycetota bacterium]
WHGTYEIAQHFYIKMVPELEHLIEKGERSEDPKKVEAAAALQKLLDETLAHDDHKWFNGEMDAAEAAARKKAAEDFKNRYK